jgi:hypothetical protein
MRYSVPFLCCAGRDRDKRISLRLHSEVNILRWQLSDGLTAYIFVSDEGSDHTETLMCSTCSKLVFVAR